MECLLKAATREATVNLLKDCLGKASLQRAKLWQLRSAVDLVNVSFGERQKEEAIAVLRPIYESFEEGFTTTDMVAAQSLLQVHGKFLKRHT
jgi:predicted ATPase